MGGPPAPAVRWAGDRVRRRARTYPPRAVVRALAISLVSVAAVATAALGVTASGAAPSERRETPRVPGGDSPVYPGLRTVADLSQPGGAASATPAGTYPRLDATSALSFPRPGAIASARRFAAARKARVSFAVVDTRGAIGGVGIRRRFRSASLSKAMVMIAFLNGLKREPSPDERRRLAQMVRISDNDAATALHRQVGPRAMLALARRARMRDFSDTGSWSESTVSAGDQARLFAALDRLVAPRHLAFARRLLQSITATQRWGIPRVARRGWRVLFKGGWRPNGGGSLVHQAARLERGPRTVAVAVLTDGSAGQPYGEKTIQGVAARLLAPPVVPRPAPQPPLSPAELMPVRRLAGREAPPRRCCRASPARAFLWQVGSTTIRFHDQPSHAGG